MQKKKFYITTPIYYPSGSWHIGTCYTTVVCDAIARFKRLQGYDVFYLTGTDEHGQKIEKVAQDAGVPTKQYIDANVNKLKELWKKLQISYDKFIRTTDDDHEKAVQKIFQKLYDNGDIYKNKYEGWYCRPCESFWTDAQRVDGKCPDCGRDLIKTEEEGYFFRLSKYQDRILKLLEENPDFLQPRSRQNEMINNFLKPGLQDLFVTRTSFKWGIQVPFDPKHIIYVWIDALTNYITALGYMSDDDSLFKKYWPADVHMMAKEIVRFHSIIWPAILMALDLPLPKQVYAHGWLLFGNDKISKSKASSAIVDPFFLTDKYSVDALRYYLLREVPFGQDGSYTNSSFLFRINADLANTLGNLVSRSCAMCEQYFGGLVPKPSEYEDIDKTLIKEAEEALAKIIDKIDKFQIPDALQIIFDLLSSANKYIDVTAPWVLAKDESKKERLQTVIYVLLETIRFANVLLQAFLVETPNKIFNNLGINEDSKLRTFASLKKFGVLNVGGKIVKGDALFARINIDKELELLAKMSKEKEKAQEKAIENKDNILKVEEIDIDLFAKIQLKTAEILSAEKVEKSSKLLKLSVDCGEEKPRTIVSGIAKYYRPEDIVGKKVIVVANLKPCKLCGIESQGMILCAGNKDQLSFISLDRDMPNGSEVS